eukprot:390349-Hanusia_phi.AAC.1
MLLRGCHPITRSAAVSTVRYHSIRSGPAGAGPPFLGPQNAFPFWGPADRELVRSDRRTL